MKYFFYVFNKCKNKIPIFIIKYILHYYLYLKFLFIQEMNYKLKNTTNFVLIDGCILILFFPMNYNNNEVVS